MDVNIHDTHLEAFTGQGKSEVDGDGAFTDAAFATHNHDGIFYLRQSIMNFAVLDQLFFLGARSVHLLATATAATTTTGSAFFRFTVARTATATTATTATRATAAIGHGVQNA
jgi:hypothetical protein